MNRCLSAYNILRPVHTYPVNILTGTGQAT